MSNDLLWLILSYVAVGLIIGIATWAGTGGGRSPEITRKIIHIGVGTWIIPTTLFFDSPWMAIIPPASFVLINLLSYRFHLVKAMEDGDRNPGTIYFPLAFVILILLFWPGGIWADQAAGIPERAARLPALAGILVLAWGDAAAAIIGRAVGRHRYRAFGATRSYEGSLAFVVFGTLAIVVSRLLVAEPPAGGSAVLTPLIPYSLLRVLPATLLEAVTPFGLDNLVVPMAVALMVFCFG
ncbi:MAG: phosphatidate cytidylyltransferase [bacterium]|nr:MAG: phosphatidate cytidylyltransferase [bacterium]